MPKFAPVALFLLSCLSVAAVRAGDERVFDFDYQTRIGPFDQRGGDVHVFIPLAVEDAQQELLAETIDSSIPGTVETEPRYGNRFWHGRLAAGEGDTIEVRVTSRVRRRSDPGGQLPPEQQASVAQFLEPNERVPVGHAILDPIRAEVRAQAEGDEPSQLARATYDWVVDNVEYKKVGTGWGNGDTFWACREGYGNCTDFHALFISLARSEGIPARFEIGFPVPSDRAAGQIGGYHCWVRFHLADSGWFPVDASEASKHPEKREYFYGSHPLNRIQFSIGRDLRLGDEHHGAPLNYFVYPHVEQGGEIFEGEVINTFSYRDAR